MDRDIGYGILRMSEDQRWRPYFLGNPVYAFLLMVLFQYGVALHELETERIRSGEITARGQARDPRGHLAQDQAADAEGLRGVPAAGRAVRAVGVHRQPDRQPDPQRVVVHDHLLRPLPGRTHRSSPIEETKDETRGMWYFRQILGSANLTGGKLFHMLSGNLSFQIEHHLFPDIPAHRHAEIARRGAGDLRALRHPVQHAVRCRKQFATVVRKIVRLTFPDSWVQKAGAENGPQREPVAA